MTSKEPWKLLGAWFKNMWDAASEQYLAKIGFLRSNQIRWRSCMTGKNVGLPFLSSEGRCKVRPVWSERFLEIYPIFLYSQKITGTEVHRAAHRSAAGPLQATAGRCSPLRSSYLPDCQAVGGAGRPLCWPVCLWFYKILKINKLTKWLYPRKSYHWILGKVSLVTHQISSTNLSYFQY